MSFKCCHRRWYPSTRKTSGQKESRVSILQSLSSSTILRFLSRLLTNGFNALRGRNAHASHVQQVKIRARLPSPETELTENEHSLLESLLAFYL